MNNMLRGKIIERFGSCSAFAKEMGLTSPQLSWRLNNRTDWKRGEIAKAAKLLGIHHTGIGAYFFPETLDVSEGRSNA